MGFQQNSSKPVGLLGDELVSALKDFFLSPFMPKAMNSTSLVLIPKRAGADSLSEFRPISCLNTVYKIITHILADRLKVILPNIILPNQTAFVKDRLLLENVLLASEVLNGYHKSLNTRRITLKIDISKAFDSVRWDFLLSALQEYQFPLEFLNCIRACICSPAFSVSINGTTSGFFKGKSGLRQGDPLSPPLFVLAMNVLSLMLNKAASEGVFKYHPGCEDLQLTHLSFADDLLIFLEGTFESLEGVFSILSKFESLSGLSVNLAKTSMFCSGVECRVLQEIQTRYELTPGSLPIHYLGLPLCSRKLSTADCDPLLAQIRKKLNSWTHKHLSLAGRYTLISTVISGIIGFLSSAFFIPKQVIRRINTMSNAYFCHSTSDSAKGAKVSWEALSVPKKEGGLGLRNLSSWNETCGLKLIWMLYFRAGSLWVAWLRQKYLSQSTCWALIEKNYRFSWMFRKLLKLRPKASTFLRIKIGNGEDTFFWWDPWTPFGPLIKYFGNNGPTSLGIPLFATVNELITPTGWNLSASRSEKQTLLHAFITTIPLSHSSDSASWMIEDEIQKSFISRIVWNKIRESKPIVPWSDLVWHKARIPKHAFTVWLFVLNRNPTLDRLVHWGCDVEHTYLLCGVEEESRNHLFFQCPFSLEIWTAIVSKLLPLTPPFQWDCIIQWLPTVSTSKDVSLVLLQAWQACIYEIWYERNQRYHSGISLPASMVLRKVVKVIINRTQALVLHNPDRSSLLQCWTGN